MRNSVSIDDHRLGALFRDREHAGRMLARALEPLRDHDPMVFGLARGGVVLAAIVAKRLCAPLDVLICKKVGAPRNPEYAIGAVAPGGIKVVDEYALGRLGITDEAFGKMARHKSEEIARRLKEIRGDRPFADLAGKAVIIVDDGLATGATALSAVRFVRELDALKIVVAVPVCSNAAESLLKREGVDLVCISEPSPFYSVGQWYESFTQVEDEEVIRLLHA